MEKDESTRLRISEDFEKVRSEIIKGLKSMTEEDDLYLMERAWELVIFCQKERYIKDHIELLTPEEVDLWKGMVWLPTDEALRRIKEREGTA